MPTRGTTSQFVDIHSHTYLIDAGEGVQLALRKTRRRFQKLRGVFISHMHGDHVLGLPGLLSTMSLLGRKDALDVWGPPGLEEWMSTTWKAIEAHMTFEVRFKTWSGSEPLILLESEKYRLTAIPVKHRIPCCGLKVEEHSLPWNLDGKKPVKPGCPTTSGNRLSAGSRSNLKAKSSIRPSGVHRRQLRGAMCIQLTRVLAPAFCRQLKGPRSFTMTPRSTRRIRSARSQRITARLWRLLGWRVRLRLGHCCWATSVSGTATLIPLKRKRCRNTRVLRWRKTAWFGA